MILITGASRGIGNFLAKKYFDLSMNVFGTYNNSKNNLDFDKRIFCKVDVTNIDSIKKWINSLNIDKEITLINCAGITYNSFAHKSDVVLWKKVIDVNLIGTFNVIRTILPIMRDNNYGRIINFSSVVAQKQTPGVSAYASSKSGLWGMTKTLCIENAAKGITINNINLGYSEIGMIDEVPNKFKEIILSEIPSGNFCSKEDIFRCVEFIRNNSSLNGTSIDLNGGLF